MPGGTCTQQSCPEAVLLAERIRTSVNAFRDCWIFPWNVELKIVELKIAAWKIALLKAAPETGSLKTLRRGHVEYLKQCGCEMQMAERRFGNFFFRGGGRANHQWNTRDFFVQADWSVIAASVIGKFLAVVRRQDKSAFVPQTRLL